MGLKHKTIYRFLLSYPIKFSMILLSTLFISYELASLECNEVSALLVITLICSFALGSLGTIQVGNRGTFLFRLFRYARTFLTFRLFFVLLVTSLHPFLL